MATESLGKWKPEPDVCDRLAAHVDDERILAMLREYGGDGAEWFSALAAPGADLSLLRLALVHRSVKNEAILPVDNESLEFLGDSQLGAAVTVYICTRFEGSNEAELSRLKTRIVNNDDLGRVAKLMGFHKLVLLGKSVEMGGGRENLRILGSTLEAWIGAMYLTLAHLLPHQSEGKHPHIYNKSSDGDGGSGGSGTSTATDVISSVSTGSVSGVGVSGGSGSERPKLLRPKDMVETGVGDEPSDEPADALDMLSGKDGGSSERKSGTGASYSGTGAGVDTTTSSTPAASLSSFSATAAKEAGGGGSSGRHQYRYGNPGGAFAAVLAFLSAVLDRHVPEMQRVKATTDDYKSLLQVHIQHEQGGVPEYRLLSAASVPSNGVTFVARCMLPHPDDREVGKGKGSDKKSARQQAAQAAMAHLGVPTRAGDANFIGQLQEHFQKARKPLPTYLDEEERCGARFTVSVHAPFTGKELGRGSGPNKATAEQEAARAALTAIRERLESMAT